LIKSKKFLQEEVFMNLTNKQRSHLRSLAHHLKPVVMVGDKGITENLLAELDRALEAHELIKVSISGADKKQRRTLSEELCQNGTAELVQMIGHITVLYRPAQEPKIVIA
jgi:RNA-binding protein